MTDHPAEDFEAPTLGRWKHDHKPTYTELEDAIDSLKHSAEVKAEYYRQLEREPVGTKAHEICAEAARLTAGDREITHGDKPQNFMNIGTMFTAILQVAGVLAPGKQVDAHLAATLCEGLKIARRFTGTVNMDDYIDGAGYAGIAGEVIHASRRTT